MLCRVYGEGHRVLWAGRAIQGSGAVLAQHDLLRQPLRLRVLGSLPPHREGQRATGGEVFRKRVRVPQESEAIAGRLISMQQPS